jgi:hypothetical protein
MNEQRKVAAGKTVISETRLVQRVMIFSGMLSVVFAAGGWYLTNWLFAQSVLIGCMLVNGSFWLLKTDIQRLMQRLGGAEGHQDAALAFEKPRFFLRFYARLIVLGLLLFVLASKATVNMIGLTLGLSTVMFSVVIIGLSTGKCWTPSKV